MAMLSQEIERLTLAIRGREEEINSGQGVIRNLQGEIENWKRRFSELENSAGHEIHTKVSSYEQRICLLYTSPSPRDLSTSRMPSSA